MLEKDVRPDIRAIAAWALGKIGGEEAQDALLRRKMKENDEEALQEIEKGLQFFTVEDEV